MNKNITVLSCSIFRNEIETFLQKRKFNIIFIDSMLHMNPQELNAYLKKTIEEEIHKGNKVLLLYGDCSPSMRDFEKNGTVVRVTGINCCEILVGKEKYRELRKKRVFFLLEEWLVRWKEIFKKHLGLKDDIEKNLMKDMHSSLLYLHTGFRNIPVDTLNEIASFTGLEWNILTISPDNIQKEIDMAIENFDI
ncbi:MAG: DUF1638 domain-containing protein [Candidatus Eremiobacterota bacterium]